MLILVVDDNKINQHIVCKMLERLGHVVACATAYCAGSLPESVVLFGDSSYIFDLPAWGQRV